MPLRVWLAGGSEVGLGVQRGAPVRQLWGALSTALDVPQPCVRLCCGAAELVDNDLVPDGDVSALIFKKPWVDDGSGYISDDNGSGKFTVAGEPKRGDSKFNALCDIGQADGELFFEVEVLNGSGAFIGVTTRAAFAPGYKLKALLFGGNLSDGSGLKRSQFGDRVEALQTIGVLADLRDPTQVTVTFWQDQQCLGPAFIASRSSPGAEVFPVVSARSVGDSFVLRSRPCPYSSRERGGPAGSAHPAVGQWQLRRLCVGPELGEFPLAARLAGSLATLKVETDRSPPAQTGQQALKLQFHVCNRIMATAVATSAGEGEVPYPFEKLQLGPPTSTRMMGPPGLMQVEEAVSAGLAVVDRWVARGDAAGANEESLLLVGPTIEMAFEPHQGTDDGPITTVALP